MAKSKSSPPAGLSEYADAKDMGMSIDGTVCTTSTVQFPAGTCFVFATNHPRSRLGGAHPDLKHWLRYKGGVQFLPTPGANLNLGLNPTWIDFIENWQHSAAGFREWRVRKDEPSKYGTYANRRIFLNFDLVKPSVQNLLLGVEKDNDCRQILLRRMEYADLEQKQSYPLFFVHLQRYHTSAN